ncbi:MAG: hypothetical protein QM278_10865 [Pseudomonadota bacterium]|nr:hypothetical protein [Pseudomonadota bacterium]
MKKRILPLFFAVLLLFLASPAFAAVPLLGDLNADGRTDLSDTIEILQILSGMDMTGKTINLNNADIDLDGRIGLAEAIFTLQAAAGLREAGVETGNATGTVNLPAGFSLSLTTLLVHGELGSANLGADGGFSVPLAGAGEALAVVTGADGTPLLMGYVKAGSANVIDASATAAALIFQALGAFTLPPSTWAEFRAWIAAQSQTATLASVIETQLAANPLAISQGDAAIRDAVEAAAADIAALRSAEGAGTGRAALGAATPVTAATVTVSRSPLSADVTHVKIDGANPRSGINIEPAADGSGVTARNEYRRHILILVYRTGWESTDGTRHDLPWEQVADGPFDPLAKGAYLGATNAVGGVITSVIDWFFKNGAYIPSSLTDAIPLPMYAGAPADSVAKTFYRVVCVGDYLGAEAVPAELADIKTDLEAAYNAMQALEFFKEFLLPLVFAVIPSDQIAANLKLNKEYLSAAIDMVNLVSTEIADVGTNIAAGSYGSAIVAVAKGLVSNPTLLNRVGARLARIGIVKGWNAATDGLITSVAKKAMVLLSIVDKVVTAFDESILMAHLASSHGYEQWDATALWPNVRIQPAPAKVEAAGTVQLLVTVGGETGNSDNYYYRFTWTTSGVYGKIADPDRALEGTEVVMTSRSPGARINYRSNADAAEGDTDTVSIVVHRVGTAGQARLGEGQTTVKVSGGSVNLTPATVNIAPEGSQAFASVVKPDPETGDVYTYRWENSALYGHLTEGDAFESTTVTAVTYNAGKKEGVDSLSLSVYRQRDGGEKELLGIGSSMINVRNPCAVALSPQGRKLDPGGVQAFTATLIPEPAEGTQIVYTWSNTATAGTLTGDGGTNRFEQTGNQATYTAGANYGADRITVKVQRLSGGERFDLAEASVNVIVGNFTLTMQDLTVNQGNADYVWVAVSPYLEIGDAFFYKWTNSGLKGQLSDVNSGQTDHFETENFYALYQAQSDVVTGADTVTVELYARVDGTPVFIGSATAKVKVKGKPVLMNAVVRKMTAEAGPELCGTAYGYPNYVMYGMVSLSWQPPADFTPSSYTVNIDNHGNVVNPNHGNLIAPFFDHSKGFTCPWPETESEAYCTVWVGTIPVGSVGYRIEWTRAQYNEYYKAVHGTKEQHFSYRYKEIDEAMSKASTWTIEVWANP